MKQALEVLSRYARCDDIFVFPSEVTADFWRLRIQDLAGVSTVRVDRVVSWDRFKECAFPGNESRLPANSAFRTIFLQAFAEKNASEALLTSIIPERFADNSRSFIPHLQSLLPNLKTLNEAIARYPAFPDAGLSADYRLLYGEYRSFLDAYGLYEPNYEERRPARLPGQAVIFFPELIDDYDELAVPLEETGKVRLVRVEDSPLPTLRLYENSFQEIRALALALGELLDRGIPADEIAVTFPDLDRYREVLLEQAKIQGVPLRIREGRPLSGLPGGRFFSLLRQAGGSGFHVDDLKAFLCGGIYPWKRPDLARTVVKIGTERFCMGRAGREILWNRALRDLPEVLRPGRDYFRALEAAVRRLTEAKNFRELSIRANAFASEFFDLGGWDGEVLKEYQISLDCLSDLAAMEETTRVPVHDPFDLWLRSLDARIYVPKGTELGVDVFSYRVSAGIRPRRHFVVNAGQEETRVVHGPFGFLRDDLKKVLGLEDRDLGGAFLALYGVSGEEVRFSSSVESRLGVRLPPSGFVSAGRVEEMKTAGDDGLHDAAEAERRFWSGVDEKVIGLPPYAAEGFGHFLKTGFAKKGTDFAGARMPPAFADFVCGRLRREGSFSVSSSALETYTACPFRFFLERAIGLSDESRDTGFEDPRFSGDRFHEAFGLLFKRIEEADGRFLPERTGVYRAWFGSVLDETFSRIGSGPRLPLPPVLTSLRSSIEEALGGLLDREGGRYGGYEVAGVELTLESNYAEGVGLRGRMDRISRNPEGGGILLVDYKSGQTPSKKQILGESKSAPVSFQIPFYVLLAGLAGFRAEEAVYYQVTKGEYLVVLGKGGWFDGESFKPVTSALEKAIGSMAEGLESGDYRAKPDDCRFCGFRMVCRTKYSIG